MPRILCGSPLLALALIASGCSRGDQAAPATENIGATGNIEEMGPDGGGNATTTPPASADNAPVGSADNGNVTPGDTNPASPRGAATGGSSNSQ